MWNFIQTQVLGMKWLERLVGFVLNSLGIELTTPMGGTLLFFLYDTVKILILLVVLIFTISFIQTYFPPQRSRKILGKFHGISANLIGALLGTVTPFCSCSSIPLFMGFTAAGLPIGVTFSFLISSPMVDLGSLILLMSIWGWKVAVVYVALGLMIAVTGGTIIEKCNMESEIEEFIRKAGVIEVEQDRMTAKERCKIAVYQVKTTLKKVFPYILLGVAIGALIHNWIPERMVISLLGTKNPFGVVLAVLVGIPMYADIFGTIPVAEALLGKGALLGVVLSFMMAVTTLSVPSIVMLRRVVKKRLMIIFVAVCTIGIILVGYLFNILQVILI